MARSCPLEKDGQGRAFLLRVSSSASTDEPPNSLSIETLLYLPTKLPPLNMTRKRFLGN
jgi:hypothetical protein